MPHLRTWLAATLAVLVPSMLMAAPLPVKIDRFEGEVVQVNGPVHSGVLPGKNLQEGTQVQTGPDGRAELSFNGATTLSVGGGSDLLVHSVESGVLRLRIASGALHVDTRAAGTKPARDVRLNIGDLRLRIQEADAWAELGDRGGQVCLVSGVVEAQQPNTTLRLDTPGQCLRQSGLTSQWSMVPVSVLDDRVALVSVREPAAAAPKPAPQIKALPLPVEPGPSATIVAREPAPASPAAQVPTVVALEKTVPVPAAAAPPSNVDTAAPQIAKVGVPAVPQVKAQPAPIDPDPTPKAAPPAAVAVIPGPATTVDPAHGSALVTAPKPAPVVIVEKAAVPPSEGAPPAKPATKPTESAATFPHVPPVIIIDKPVGSAMAGESKPAPAPIDAPLSVPTAPVVIVEKAAVPSSEGAPPAKPTTKRTESAATFPHVPPVIIIDKPVESAVAEQSKPAPAPIDAPLSVPTPAVATPPAHTPAVVIDKPAQVAIAAKPAAPPVAGSVVKNEPVPLHPHVPPVIVIESPAESGNSSASAKGEALPSPAPPPVMEKLPEAPAPAGTVAMAFPSPLEVPALPKQPAVKPLPAKAAVPSPGPIAPKADAKPVTASEAPASETRSTKAITQLDTELAMVEPGSPGTDDGRRWRVVLGSMPEQDKADIEAERLNARGWAVEAREYRVGDRHGYRIGFGEFAERDQAQKALEEFLVQYPEAPAWLAKY